MAIRCTPSRLLLTAALLMLLLPACGGGGGGGGGEDPDPPVPPGPDVTPPTISLDAPQRSQALIAGDLLSITFTADDDRTANVEIVLDVDGDPVTTVDQISLFTGTDQNGTPVTVDLDTTGAMLGRATLIAIADDGANAPVTDLGPDVLFHAALAGVVSPRHNTYGVVQGLVFFGVGEAGENNTDRNGDGDAGDAVMSAVDSLTGTETDQVLTVDASPVVGAPATRVLPPHTGYVAWTLREADENADLNGLNGATDVLVGFAKTAAQFNLVGGATLASAGAPGYRVVQFNETAAGIPGGLNGDGDTFDDVIAVLDHSTNTIVVYPDELKPGTSFSGSYDGFGMYLTDETVSGKILNGDGDALDILPVICDVSGQVALPAGLNNVDPTGAFATSRTDVLGVYYVDEFLAGGVDKNGDGDAVDFIPAVNWGGVETFPGTGLSAGVGARYAFGEGPLVVYLAGEEGLVDRNGDLDVLDTEVIHWTDVSVNATTANTVAPVGFGLTGLTLDGGSAAQVGPGWLSLVVSETANGKDFNADADMGDLVFMLMDLTVSPPVIHNTGLVPVDPATLVVPGATIPITGVGGELGVVVQAAETANGILNGDGDAVDTLLFLYRFSAPTTRVDLTDTGGLHASVGGRIAVTAYEGLTNTDFNGDGDTLDFVLRVFNLTGTVREPGRLCDQTSIPATDDSSVWAYLRSEVAELRDLNGDGDQTDLVLGLWLP